MLQNEMQYFKEPATFKVWNMRITGHRLGGKARRKRERARMKSVKQAQLLCRYVLAEESNMGSLPSLWTNHPMCYFNTPSLPGYLVGCDRYRPVRKGLDGSEDKDVNLVIHISLFIR